MEFKLFFVYENISFPYIARVLLHLMLVRMILTRPASPEAVLTQLVIGTSLALVAEPSEGTDLARIASNRVIDIFNGRHSVQQR